MARKPVRRQIVDFAVRALPDEIEGPVRRALNLEEDVAVPPTRKPSATKKSQKKADTKPPAKQKIAERRRASAAAFSNLSALGQGVKSIPGRVVNYIKTTTPSGVARDVGDVAASTFSALKDDPAGFIGDAIFSPFAAVRDIGDLRAKAAELRRRGLNKEAQKLEALAGTMVLSAIPVVGRVAGTAVRDAEKAALRSAAGKSVKYIRKEEGPFLRVEREGVEPQIVPEVKEAKNIDQIRTILRNIETNPAARAADEYTNRELGRKYNIDMPAPGTSLEKQSGIARVFEEGVEGSPEYKQALFEAYGTQMPEVVEQAGAQNYDQLKEAAYRQLAEETKKQFASMPVRTAYHYGPGEYATPSAMLRDVLGEGNLNVYRGGDPHEFLSEVDPDTDLTYNEMFRAVHDLFGHGTTGSTFRPGGEEIAYASHSQMMSPLAQMAMLAETRGQNSFVNYSPLNVALFEKRRPILLQIEELKNMDRMRGEPGASAAEIAELNAELRRLGGETQYAPQTTLLLPPEYLPAETTGGVPEYLRGVIKPRSPSAPERAVHLSRAPDLTMTDPSYYGTGHRGADYAIRGMKGSPKEHTSFYLGEEGTVIPEAVVADISPHAYEASLQDLYDVNLDPESIVRLANALAKRGETSLPDITRMIRERGYKGYRTSNFVSTPGQGAAAVFDPVELIRPITRGPRGFEEGGLAHSSSSPGNMN